MAYGYLSHHGIKGQKCGIRRYQNEDGSLTAEGKVRYNHHMYEKGNRQELYGSLARSSAVTKFKDARETIKKESTKNLDDDRVDELAYELLKSQNPGSYDPLRSYYAYKASKEEWSQLGKNALGLIGLSTVGVGVFDVGSAKVNYYKSKYKEMTDKLISELELKDKTHAKI